MYLMESITTSENAVHHHTIGEEDLYITYIMDNFRFLCLCYIWYTFL